MAAQADFRETIAQQIASTDREQRRDALHRIAVMFDLEPQQAARHLNWHWLKPLLEAGEYEQIVQWTAEAMIHQAFSARGLEILLSYRVEALIRLGRAEEAVRDAKRMYNVVTLENTHVAVQRVVQALEAAYPDDPGIVRRFKAEQVVGPRPQPGPLPEGEGRAPEATVLAGIKLDPAAWERALSEHRGSHFDALTARGNLMLMMDRFDEARELFELAYRRAIDHQLPTAAESLARLMRAEDGTIARANEWLLSNRVTSSHTLP